MPPDHGAFAAVEFQFPLPAVVTVTARTRVLMPKKRALKIPRKQASLGIPEPPISFTGTKRARKFQRRCRVGWERRAKGEASQALVQRTSAKANAAPTIIDNRFILTTLSEPGRYPVFLRINDLNVVLVQQSVCQSQNLENNVRAAGWLD